LKRILAERSVVGAFGATVVSLLLLVTWARELRVGWLLAAFAVWLAAVALTWKSGPHRHTVAAGPPPSVRPRRALTAALSLLVAGMGVALLFTVQFQRLERDWTGLLQQREAGVGATLSRQMADIVERGASDSRAGVKGSGGGRRDRGERSAGPVPAARRIAGAVGRGRAGCLHRYGRADRLGR
jgi:hypothetical protein